VGGGFETAAGGTGNQAVYLDAKSAVTEREQVRIVLTACEEVLVDVRREADPAQRHAVAALERVRDKAAARLATLGVETAPA
jgi:hypothetical protein